MERPTMEFLKEIIKRFEDVTQECESCGFSCSMNESCALCDVQEVLIGFKNTGLTPNEITALQAEIKAISDQSAYVYAENQILLTEIAELKAQLSREKESEPLSLEQLKQMGGEPYYHVSLQGNESEWRILNPLLAPYINDYHYGDRWLAYAQKPGKDEETTVILKSVLRRTKVQKEARIEKQQEAENEQN